MIVFSRERGEATENSLSDEKGSPACHKEMSFSDLLNMQVQFRLDSALASCCIRGNVVFREVDLSGAGSIVRPSRPEVSRDALGGCLSMDGILPHSISCLVNVLVSSFGCGEGMKFH